MAAIQVGLLVLVALVLVAVYLTMKVVKPLIYNSIVGLIALLAVDYLGIVEIDLSIWAVAIVALGGLPGAALVVLLAFLGVAF
ncbi:MAG: pro-sigmaK processing inhibitor BofA family protein [Halobacteriota archaeon]